MSLAHGPLPEPGELGGSPGKLGACPNADLNNATAQKPASPPPPSSPRPPTQIRDSHLSRYPWSVVPRSQLHITCGAAISAADDHYLKGGRPVLAFSQILGFFLVPSVAPRQNQEIPRSRSRRPVPTCPESTTITPNEGTDHGRLFLRSSRALPLRTGSGSSSVFGVGPTSRTGCGTARRLP